MKGPAGYGRYDNDPAYVGCPWARSSRSKCVARAGREALDGALPDAACMCCGNTPEYLIEDLAGWHEPARALLARGDPAGLADDFAVMVREMTEPAEL